MSLLGKKMWRTMWRQKGQFIAMTVLVMLGMTVFVEMNTASSNLSHSVATYYSETRFADYYFPVVGAPESVVARIRQVRGVEAAVGRIQEDVPVWAAGERHTARVIAYPADNSLNLFQLTSGRLFAQTPLGGHPEVLVDPRCAQAHDLRPNDTIRIIAAGHMVSLTVVGTAISPEFVYNAPGPPNMSPDPRTFGNIMLPLTQAQDIFNLPGEINQVAVKLAPNADVPGVVARVDAILHPYGDLDSYSKEQPDQFSNYFVNIELKTVWTMSVAFPTLFFGVALGGLFILLSRLVKSQRPQIGVMKALGFTNRQIVWHYAAYGLVVSLAGGLIGAVSGVAEASLVAWIYAQWFILPAVISVINYQVLLTGLFLSLAVGTLAGLVAARGAVAVHPAEAMRPEPPKSSGRIVLESWAWFWRRLPSTWKMSLRSIGRNKIRFLVTTLGVAVAVGLMLGALAANDSLNAVVHDGYYNEQHFNVLVTFATPVPEGAVLDIARLDGVLATEPFLEIPVQATYQGRSRHIALLGLPPGGTLKPLATLGGTPLDVSGGILVDQRTAGILGVKTGDRVEVKTTLPAGPPHYALVPVAGIARESLGSDAYISLTRVNRIVREQDLASGVMLVVDPGREAAVENRLNQWKNISSIQERRVGIRNFWELLSDVVILDDILVGFAIGLGFAIIFNTSVMGFSERKREFASMLVIGFSPRQIGRLLWQENILQSFLGILLGLPLGYLIGAGYMTTVDSAAYTVPVAIAPASYLLSVGAGLLFVALASWFTIAGLRKLNMVDVLKDQD